MNMRILSVALVLLSIGISGKGQIRDFEKLPSVGWRFRINAPIISSPIISDNSVYFAGLDSTVYALDLASGKLNWKLKTNGEIRSTVAISGDKLFLAGGNGILSCINKLDGKVLWRNVFDPTAVFLAERRYDFADYYHSSPVIHNDVIFLGTANGKMSAYKIGDGSLIWSFRAGDIIHNTPVVINDKLYFGSFDGNVYALSITSGEIVWKFKSVGQQYFPRGELQGSPAAGMNTVIIGGRDYNTYALDAREGFANWNRKFAGGWALSSTYKDSVVYIGTSDDRLLLALDAGSGRERWKTDVKFNIFGNCVFTSSMVYVGTIWGKVYGIDKKTGNIRWGFSTDGHKANHDKYFKADDQYRDDIGQTLKAPVQWVAAEYSMGGVFSTPAISNDVMVITTTEGTVYGLKR